MDRHEQGAGQTGIVGHQLKQHETRAHARFGEHERHRQRRAASRRMARREGASRPHQQRDDGEEREAAGESMRGLHQHLDAGARGRIAPSQSGQCAPQPAPDPDART